MEVGMNQGSSPSQASISPEEKIKLLIVDEPDIHRRAALTEAQSGPDHEGKDQVGQDRVINTYRRTIHRNVHPTACPGREGGIMINTGWSCGAMRHQDE
jgi:hypothetical protein